MIKTDVDLLDRVTLSGSEKQLEVKPNNSKIRDRIEVVRALIGPLESIDLIFRRSCDELKIDDRAAALRIMASKLKVGVDLKDSDVRKAGNTLITLTDGKKYHRSLAYSVWLFIQIDAAVEAVVLDKSLSLIISLHRLIDKQISSEINFAQTYLIEAAKRLDVRDKQVANAKKMHVESDAGKAKAEVRKYWEACQKDPTKFRGGVAFARSAIAELNLKLQESTITKWCRGWTHAQQQN